MTREGSKRSDGQENRDKEYVCVVYDEVLSLRLMVKVCALRANYSHSVALALAGLQVREKPAVRARAAFTWTSPRAASALAVARGTPA